MEAAVTEPIAIVRDYDGLIAALRLRKAELGLSDDTLESISGLAKGHISKILPASRVKHMGPHTLKLMLGALAVQLAVVVDPEQMARLQNRMERRDEKRVRGEKRTRKQADGSKHQNKWLITKRISPQLNALRHISLDEKAKAKIARLGGRARAKKLSREDRKRIARKAACDRWKRLPSKAHHRP